MSLGSIFAFKRLRENHLRTPTGRLAEGGRQCWATLPTAKLEEKNPRYRIREFEKAGPEEKWGPACEAGLAEFFFTFFLFFAVFLSYLLNFIHFTK